jgi:arylsulfatase A-like enzyme
MIKDSYLAAAIIALPLAFGGAASAQIPAKKPNIVMIMGDDVGMWNLRAYHRGIMGGSTPNIDRIVKEKLLQGMKVGNKTFKNYLDGYNFVPFLKGESAKGPRHEFFYFTDNGDLTAVRYDDWKVTFKTIKGNLFTGSEETTNVPLVTNLRQDPWERYQEQSMMYARWWG